MEVLTESEKVRRRELNADSRAALALGLSLDEYRARRDVEVEAWCQFLRSEMDRLGADEPGEVLPQLAVRIEERCTAAARKIAEATAKSVVALMLRKAISS
jgi:hypothetical protein